MTRGRKATATAAMLAAALVLSACGGDNGDEAPTTLDPAPTTTAAPPPDDTTATTEPPDDTTATTEEPTLSPEEQDEAAVVDTVDGYFEDVLLAVIAGDSELSSINAWVIPPARDQEINRIQGFTRDGLTVVGTQEVEVLDVEVDRDQATVSSCVDVSDLDVVNDDGESVVGDGPVRTLMDVVLTRSDERSETGWQISEISSQGELCDD